MESITTDQLKKTIDKGLENSLIIDVRSEDQHQKCTIKGAKNIRPQQLLEQIDEFKKYDHIYLHCNRGGASSRACSTLEKSGLTNVVNVEGGLKSWIEAGFEIECK